MTTAEKVQAIKQELIDTIDLPVEVTEREGTLYINCGSYACALIRLAYGPVCSQEKFSRTMNTFYVTIPLAHFKYI